MGKGGEVWEMEGGRIEEQTHTNYSTLLLLNNKITVTNISYNGRFWTTIVKENWGSRCCYRELCNKLPVDISESSSLQIFRRRLTTYHPLYVTDPGGRIKHGAAEVTGSLAEALKTGDEPYWLKINTLALVQAQTVTCSYLVLERTHGQPFKASWSVIACSWFGCPGKGNESDNGTGWGGGEQGWTEHKRRCRMHKKHWTVTLWIPRLFWHYSRLLICVYTMDQPSSDAQEATAWRPVHSHITIMAALYKHMVVRGAPKAPLP